MTTDGFIKVADHELIPNAKNGKLYKNNITLLYRIIKNEIIEILKELKKVSSWHKNNECIRIEKYR